MKEFEIDYAFLTFSSVKYRLTNAVKPTKFYLLLIIVHMHIVLFFRNVFQSLKKSILFIAITLHCFNPIFHNGRASEARPLQKRL